MREKDLQEIYYCRDTKEKRDKIKQQKNIEDAKNSIYSSILENYKISHSDSLLFLFSWQKRTYGESNVEEAIRQLNEERSTYIAKSNSILDFGHYITFLTKELYDNYIKEEQRKKQRNEKLKTVFFTTLGGIITITIIVKTILLHY